MILEWILGISLFKFNPFRTLVFHSTFTPSNGQALLRFRPGRRMPVGGLAVDAGSHIGGDPTLRLLLDPVGTPGHASRHVHFVAPKGKSHFVGLKRECWGAFFRAGGGMFLKGSRNLWITTSLNFIMKTINKKDLSFFSLNNYRGRSEIFSLSFLALKELNRPSDAVLLSQDTLCCCGVDALLWRNDRVCHSTERALIL